MSALWDAATRHACAANDILSLRKEVLTTGTLPLTGVLFARGGGSGSLQAAVDGAAAEVWRSGEALEREAAVLMARYGAEPGLGRDVERLIDGCRIFCTANVRWSLVTERYGMGAMRRLDGGAIELVI